MAGPGGPASPERKTLWILAAALLGEGIPVVITTAAGPAHFAGYLGFAPGAAGTWQGWLAAAFVATLYVWGTAAIPTVREHLFRPSLLKAVALATAIMAAVLEEVIFRKWIMDALERQDSGAALQVLASGVAFGAVHAVWGFFGGSLATAVKSMVATALLGVALGVVYLVSDRSLAPCLIAHFVITALIEPGLALAAVRGELAHPLRKT